MYVRATSSRFSRGRSTPAMRATPCLLSLSLLVTRVRADHHHSPAAPDHLALVADGLDARTNLHAVALLVPIDDATARQVVRRQLDQHPIARQDADVVHP